MSLEKVTYQKTHRDWVIYVYKKGVLVDNRVLHGQCTEPEVRLEALQMAVNYQIPNTEVGWR